MSLTPYRRVLARPGVARLLLLSALARIPATAAGVVLTLHVVTTLGLGYAAAGLVATASTAGMALGAPWRGRAVDRLGLRRALIPSIVAEAFVWGTAPFVSYHLLLVVAPSAAASAAGSADRVGGSTTNSASPAATMSTPTPSRATVDDTCVATTTPAAGPTMNDTSTPMESRE